MFSSVTGSGMFTSKCFQVSVYEVNSSSFVLPSVFPIDLQNFLLLTSYLVLKFPKVHNYALLLYLLCFLLSCCFLPLALTLSCLSSLSTIFLSFPQSCMLSSSSSEALFSLMIERTISIPLRKFYGLLEGPQESPKVTCYTSDTQWI